MECVVCSGYVVEGRQVCHTCYANITNKYDNIDDKLKWIIKNFDFTHNVNKKHITIKSTNKVVLFNKTYSDFSEVVNEMYLILKKENI